MQLRKRYVCVCVWVCRCGGGCGGVGVFMHPILMLSCPGCSQSVHLSLHNGSHHVHEGELGGKGGEGRGGEGKEGWEGKDIVSYRIQSEKVRGSESRIQMAY